jgi:hypothetical protein
MTYLKERNYPVYIDKDSKSLYKGTPVAHPTVFIKAEVLKKYKYDTTISTNEDIDLWFRILSDGHSIVNINEPLIKYRITDKTFSRRSYTKAFYEFKTYWKNLVRLHGFSPLLVYPIARFISRLLPSALIKKLYFSKSREKVFATKS